jgi:hypothetical protein
MRIESEYGAMYCGESVELRLGVNYVTRRFAI